MLGRTRLVHITSLFDHTSPSVLASIIREAKDQNPWLQVSFDPGHEWVRRIKVNDNAEPIREILSLCSYLFLNRTEFELLTSDLGVRDEQDLAKDVFRLLSPHAILIFLKQYDEIRIYHKLHKRIKEIRFLNEPLPTGMVEDATGAGDVFAAGWFIGMTVPGLELRDGIQLGLKMARRKLASAGSEDFANFGRYVEEYVDLLYARQGDGG